MLKNVLLTERELAILQAARNTVLMFSAGLPTRQSVEEARILLEKLKQIKTERDGHYAA